MDEVPTLLPPGPLARVNVVPARSRVERRAERRLRARPTDAAGVRVRDVSCDWTVAEGDGAVAPVGECDAVFRAGDETGRVRVVVTSRTPIRCPRAVRCSSGSWRC